MKRLSAAALAVAILSGALSPAATPAFALGGCGPNAHAQRRAAMFQVSARHS